MNYEFGSFPADGMPLLNAPDQVGHAHAHPHEARSLEVYIEILAYSPSCRPTSAFQEEKMGLDQITKVSIRVAS